MGRSVAVGVGSVMWVRIGLQVAVRLGMGAYDSELGNSEFFERGQHATSICGAIGSATSTMRRPPTVET
jgi:hypothetical protein